MTTDQVCKKQVSVEQDYCKDQPCLTSVPQTTKPCELKNLFTYTVMLVGWDCSSTYYIKS
jgi:hypothetical protein